MKNKVLKHLERDANISRKELAERLQTTVEVIEEMIAELEADKSILGYKAVVNQQSEMEKNTVRAIIEVRVAPRREGGYDSIAKRIARFPEVTSVYLMSGGYDLSVQIDGESLQDIAGFVASRLSTIDGVISCSTHFILKKYKEAGFSYNEEDEYERLKVSP